MKLAVLPYSEESLAALDAYSLSYPQAQIMQSSDWARFQVARGATIALLGTQEEKHGPVFLAIRYNLPFGFHYWYLPRSLRAQSDVELQETAVALDEVIQRLDPKAIFWRFEPLSISGSSLSTQTVSVQPPETLLLNLQQSQAELLENMHSKTRYNIKLSAKKDLRYEKNPKALNSFLDLLEETRQRDGFRLHSIGYYKAMVESGVAELATVWSGSTLLAGSLLSFFGDTVTYLHGASSSRARDKMAPYFLHWHTICQAQAVGYAWYDWHGIDEQKWPGVTRFKKGFGGEVVTYPGTFDRPLARGLYSGYTVLRYLRRFFS